MKFPVSVLLLCLCAAAFVTSAFGQARAQNCARCEEWNRAQKPFRIFGNTYYVGTHGLSAILITSPRGHALIDGDLPQSARQIESNIQSLGFRITDVKVIVNSHVHFDHAGGIAELQRASGARVVASAWSANVLRTGRPGRGDPQYAGGIRIAPVAKVEQLQEGGQVTVDDISLNSHPTPGHTPGGTSWTWKSCEGPVCRNMVYADSLTPVSSDGFRFTREKDYPGALEDFEKSFTFLETTPCDILITVHPEVSSLWNRLKARQEWANPDPMVNPDACRELAREGRELLRKRVAQERAKPGS